MREWLKNHQLFSYFALVFLITWGSSIPHWMGIEGQALEMAFWIAGSGPSIAAIFITWLISPKLYNELHNKKPYVFWIAWAITSVVVYSVFILFESLSFAGLSQPLAIIECLLLGLIPAVILSAAGSKNPFIRKDFSSLIHPKGRIGYYLFAFLLPLLIFLISLPFDADLMPTGQAGSSQPDDFLLVFGSLISLLVFNFLFYGGFNEEVGWSGFALPRLQSKFSPLKSSYLLTIVWAVWHLPKWSTMIDVDSFSPFWNALIVALIVILQFLRLLFFRIILTWLYNKTDKGLIPPMILHVSHNLFSYHPIVDLGISGACAVFMVITSKMWRKPSVKDDSSLSPLL